VAGSKATSPTQQEFATVMSRKHVFVKLSAPARVITHFGGIMPGSVVKARWILRQDEEQTIPIANI
jgi:hypothetical protein